jgi:hypothetical protein
MAGVISLELGVFLDFVDFFCYEAMSLTMYLDGCFRIGRVHEAENLALVFVNPILDIVNAILVLLLQVLHMGFRNIPGFNSGQMVNIEKSWHIAEPP